MANTEAWLSELQDSMASLSAAAAALPGGGLDACMAPRSVGPACKRAKLQPELSNMQWSDLLLLMPRQLAWKWMEGSMQQARSAYASVHQHSAPVHAVPEVPGLAGAAAQRSKEWDKKEQQPCMEEPRQLGNQEQQKHKPQETLGSARQRNSATWRDAAATEHLAGHADVDAAGASTHSAGHADSGVATVEPLPGHADNTAAAAAAEPLPGHTSSLHVSGSGSAGNQPGEGDGCAARFASVASANGPAAAAADKKLAGGKHTISNSGEQEASCKKARITVNTATAATPQGNEQSVQEVQRADLAPMPLVEGQPLQGSQMIMGSCSSVASASAYAAAMAATASVPAEKNSPAAMHSVQALPCTVHGSATAHGRSTAEGAPHGLGAPQMQGTALQAAAEPQQQETRQQQQDQQRQDKNQQQDQQQVLQQHEGSHQQQGREGQREQQHPEQLQAQLTRQQHEQARYAVSARTDKSAAQPVFTGASKQGLEAAALAAQGMAVQGPAASVMVRLSSPAKPSAMSTGAPVKQQQGQPVTTASSQAQQQQQGKPVNTVSSQAQQQQQGKPVTTASSPAKQQQPAPPAEAVASAFNPPDKQVPPAIRQPPGPQVATASQVGLQTTAAVKAGVSSRAHLRPSPFSAASSLQAGQLHLPIGLPQNHALPSAKPSELPSSSRVHAVQHRGPDARVIQPRQVSVIVLDDTDEEGEAVGAAHPIDTGRGLQPVEAVGAAVSVEAVGAAVSVQAVVDVPSAATQNHPDIAAFAAAFARHQQGAARATAGVAAGQADAPVVDVFSTKHANTQQDGTASVTGTRQHVSMAAEKQQQQQVAQSTAQAQAPLMQELHQPSHGVPKQQQRQQQASSQQHMQREPASQAASDVNARGLAQNGLGPVPSASAPQEQHDGNARASTHKQQQQQQHATTRPSAFAHQPHRQDAPTAPGEKVKPVRLFKPQVRKRKSVTEAEPDATALESKLSGQTAKQDEPALMTRSSGQVSLQTSTSQQDVSQCDAASGERHKAEQSKTATSVAAAGQDMAATQESAATQRHQAAQREAAASQACAADLRADLQPPSTKRAQEEHPWASSTQAQFGTGQQMQQDTTEHQQPPQQGQQSPQEAQTLGSGEHSFPTAADGIAARGVTEAPSVSAAAAGAPPVSVATGVSAATTADVCAGSMAAAAEPAGATGCSSAAAPTAPTDTTDGVPAADAAAHDAVAAGEQFPGATCNGFVLVDPAELGAAPRAGTPPVVQQRVAARLAAHQAQEAALQAEAQRRDSVQSAVRTRLQQQHGRSISTNNLGKFLADIGIPVTQFTPGNVTLARCTSAQAQAALRKALRAARVQYHPDKVQQQLRAAQAARQAEEASGAGSTSNSQVQGDVTLGESVLSALGKRGGKGGGKGGARGGAKGGRGGRSKASGELSAAAREQIALEQLVWAEEICKVLNAFDLSKARW